MFLYALLAMFMVVASYVFLVLLALACVYLPYLLVASSSSPTSQAVFILLGGIVIAGIILWSLIPRPDQFSPPGLLLERRAHPRLFAELDSIASALGEEVPGEVYLIGDANCGVADRGGIMGFGSRRIMALGLPLLATLTISQFRAVLAHEFAHYYGGDTRLGPWIYKTQSAIIRTFKNIASVEELQEFWVFRIMHFLVTNILNWYFVNFLKTINFVSRRKEYRADELASLVAGPQALIDGLRAIHSAAIAWPPFWLGEVVPALNQGALPTLGNGFAQFIAVPEISRQLAAKLEKELCEGKTAPYNTHPALRDRIAALQKLPVPPVPQDTAPAITQLEDAKEVELRFIEDRNPQLRPNTIQQVEWNELGPKVTLPFWRKTVEQYASFLLKVSAGSLPDRVSQFREIGSHIADPKGMLLTPEQRTQRAGALFAMALGLALMETGWVLHTAPGTFRLEKDSHQLNPFAVIEDLRSGKLSRDQWISRCREYQILDVYLAPLSEPQQLPLIPESVRAASDAN